MVGNKLLSVRSLQICSFAMRLSLAFLAVASAQVPARPPSYIMNRSTIIMPCPFVNAPLQAPNPSRKLTAHPNTQPQRETGNNSGFTNPDSTKSWSVVDFDWCVFFLSPLLSPLPSLTPCPPPRSNAKAIWAKAQCVHNCHTCVLSLSLFLSSSLSPSLPLLPHNCHTFTPFPPPISQPHE